MNKSDTINPLGILDAAKNMWFRVLHSERGETDPSPDPSPDPNPNPNPSPDTENWRASLPDNIRSHPVFEKYKSANEALSAFVDVQKLIGPEKIIMPGKDADDKEWNERVFNRLGRPGKPEEYLLPTDLDVPKDLPISQELTQRFRQEAHKLGILPKQFQGLYKWFMSENIAQYNNAIGSQKENIEKARSELRTEWGAAFDQNLALAEKVLHSYGDDDIINSVKEKGLHSNSKFVKFLHNIGKVLSEDQMSGKPQTLTMTPEEAKSQINQMMSDPKHPIFHPEHQEHEAAMKKRDMLYRQAYPNG